MRTAFPIIVAVASVLASRAVTAHHSFAAEFDVNRPITVTGGVTRIEWTNPHAWYFIEVKKDGGAVEAWAIEVLSANGLLRRGWTRDTVKIGEVITIEGFGARDGTNTGNAAAVIRTATGERLYESKTEDRN